MKIELEIETPRVPNFVRLKMPPGVRQDGFKDAPTVAIGDLSDKQIFALGEDMKAELFKTAKRQRQEKMG